MQTRMFHYNPLKKNFVEHQIGHLVGI